MNSLQMNYWPAEATGLGSLHHQLFDLMDLMHETGKVTAKEMYGAGGWVSFLPPTMTISRLTVL